MFYKRVVEFTTERGTKVYARRAPFPFFWKYIDLVSNGYWWTKDSEYFKDCLTSDINKVLSPRQKRAVYYRGQEITQTRSLSTGQIRREIQDGQPMGGYQPIATNDSEVPPEPPPFEQPPEEDGDSYSDDQLRRMGVDRVDHFSDIN